MVPASHRDLLDRPLPAVLTTHLGTGRLQCSVVWFSPEGDDVVVSTMAEFAKAKHLAARPLATLLVTDADGRWLEVRADVTRDEDERPEDAVAVLDAIAVRYTGNGPHFGAVVPAELAEVEHPVTFRLTPVTVAAGHAVAGPMPSGPAGAPVPPDAVPLPPSHLDLLDGRSLAALATVRPDGRARTQPVRCGTDGDAVLLSADAEVLVDVAADPRATVLVLDPGNSSRWLQVRGDVSVTDAPEVGDDVIRVVPRRVICDAIH